MEEDKKIEETDQFSQIETPFVGQSFVSGVPAKERLKFGASKQQTMLMLTMMILLGAFLVMGWSLYTAVEALVINPRTAIYSEEVPEEIQELIDESQSQEEAEATE